MSQADVPSNLGRERYETLCKLLKLEAVPEVDIWSPMMAMW